MKSVHDSRFRAALAISLALHLLIAFFFPTFNQPENTNPESVQLISLAHRPQMRFEVRRSTPHTKVIPPKMHFARPLPLVARPAPKPVKHTIHTAARNEPVPARKPKRTLAPAALSQAPEQPAPRPSAIPIAAEAPPASSPTQRPAPAATVEATRAPAKTGLPSAAPATSTAVSTAQRHELSGAGPFLANYDPQLRSPEVLAEIKRLLGRNIRVEVTVDENGVAHEVRFLSAPSESLRETIRARLLAAGWIPAECSGLPCEGTRVLP